MVVNTWASANNVGADGRVGGTVDVELGRKAWEHARRRAEVRLGISQYCATKLEYRH